MISPQFLQNTLKQSDKELVKFFFIFSGDLPKLGYSELKAIFEIYNIDYDVIWLENQFCLISFKNFDEKYLIFFNCKFAICIRKIIKYKIIAVIQTEVIFKT